jgi:hypothetical protein
LGTPAWDSIADYLTWLDKSLNITAKIEKTPGVFTGG